ncbi:hypothetical protein, partial [Bradyrhizobium sp. WBAH23]|uniref:hypothetical protein n=1 Tax=Bradyrhizobium sp. WBAH23 TaxID=1390119 RepID=UPI002364966F
PDLVLLQDPDNLLFRKAATLHALVLVVGQNELQTGLSPGGKVILPRGVLVDPTVLQSADGGC